MTYKVRKDVNKTINEVLAAAAAAVATAVPINTNYTFKLCNQTLSINCLVQYPFISGS